VLSYGGLMASCDIPIDFDNDVVGLPGCRAGGDFWHATHGARTGPEIFFDDGFHWFVNDLSNVPEPVPSLSFWAGLCIGAACLAGAWLRVRGRSRAGWGLRGVYRDRARSKPWCRTA
jgi:hypothetical protein